MPTVEITTRMPEGTKVVPDALLELLPMQAEALRDWGPSSDLCAALFLLYDKPCVVTIGEFSFEDDYAQYALDKFAQAQLAVWEAGQALVRSAPFLATSAQGLAEDPSYGLAMKHLALCENVLEEVIQENAVDDLQVLHDCRGMLARARVLLLAIDPLASARQLATLALRLFAEVESRHPAARRRRDEDWVARARALELSREAACVPDLLADVLSGLAHLAHARGDEASEETRTAREVRAEPAPPSGSREAVQDGFARWQKLATAASTVAIVLVQWLSARSMRVRRH